MLLKLKDYTFTEEIYRSAVSVIYRGTGQPDKQSGEKAGAQSGGQAGEKAGEKAAGGQSNEKTIVAKFINKDHARHQI